MLRPALRQRVGLQFIGVGAWRPPGRAAQPETSAAGLVMRVEPVTAAWADALAQGDAEFTRLFGVPVAAGWAGFRETLPLLVHATREGKTAEWGPHLVFDHDGSLVGNAGWKGHPVDGVAELGYAVAPTRRNRGIATAAVSELLRQAHNAGLRLVIAHTLAKESASTAALRRCGFTKTTTRADPDDGEIWRWERIPSPPLSGTRLHSGSL